MILYIALSILMVMSRESGLSQRITTSGVTVLSGVQRTMHWIFGATESGLQNVIEVWNIRKHYVKLQDKLIDYAEYELQAQRLEKENQRLRMLLDLPPAPGFRQVIAPIVTWDPANLQHGFLIGKGYHAGVSPKMLVLAYNSERRIFGVIGRVVEVFPYSAKVVPLSHPDSFLTVKIEPSGFEGLVNGGSWSGDRLTLRYVSRNALSLLSVGDMAVTTTVRKNESDEGLLISDLYVGEIINIVDNPTLDALEVSLKSAVNIGRVEHVILLIADDVAGYDADNHLEDIDSTKVYTDFYQLQEQSGLPVKPLGSS
ncbi:rod shape-determining protein MreC [Entomospira nematocerorum]|nr:rod shape-determining protein MreC [Entomospira nematocera]